MADAIAVLNAGSSSLKFSLFVERDADLALEARGQVERIDEAPRFVARAPDGRVLEEEGGDEGLRIGHRAALERLLAFLGRARLGGVGHRVVHGGAAFAERLKQLTWMSDSTRTQALDKLAKMGEKVGYPDQWRDYSKLLVNEGPFVLNVANATVFEWERTVNRPGTAVETTVVTTRAAQSSRLHAP